MPDFVLQMCSVDYILASRSGKVTSNNFQYTTRIGCFERGVSCFFNDGTPISSQRCAKSIEESNRQKTFFQLARTSDTVYELIITLIHVVNCSCTITAQENAHFFWILLSRWSREIFKAGVRKHKTCFDNCKWASLAKWLKKPASSGLRTWWYYLLRCKNERRGNGFG